jgi:flagellar basal-body rod protein FlgG
MKALYIASTGMAAQERNVETISNNIANMRTTGYKRQRTEFQDLLYQQIRRAGTQTSDAGTNAPVGIEIGSGVKTAATTRIMSQGTPTETDKDLDLSVDGEGFFAVQLPDGTTGYTRDGSFDRDENGQLVNVNGYAVQPGITIPSDANGIQISADGIVQAYIGTASTPTQLGQLQLYRFANKEGLQSAGENNFLETAASGPAQAGTPNSEGMGKVMQGYLEEANVNPVTEIADLIAAQRAYEMNARVVTGADEMLQSISQMR